MNEEVLRQARIIWEYHWVPQDAVAADVIIALGTNDLRVAEFAAEIFLQGYGDTLVCTGGVAHQGDLLETCWEKTEAEMYADVAASRGVPRDRILLETHATNTAENIRFARDLLNRHDIRPRSIVLAVKPFMRRRVWATLPLEWPGMPATLASPRLTLDEYFTDELTPDKIINIMMGDLQRLWVYARKGWSTPQPLPAEVRQAYAQLATLGFTKHLIAEE